MKNLHNLDIPKMSVDLCVVICDGDPAAGLVLWKIQHWHALSRHIEGNRRWAKTTHAQLATKTGMSERRVKRALQKLVDTGVVERKHGVFKNGLRCSHVRVVDHILEKWLDVTEEEICTYLETGVAPVPKTGND